MSAPLPDLWAIRRLQAGWRPRAVATACGVSLRTAQRWAAAARSGEFVEVTTAGWIIKLWLPGEGSEMRPRILWAHQRESRR